jgi:biopolymer transport protein ExbB/TolQ
MMISMIRRLKPLLTITLLAFLLYCLYTIYRSGYDYADREWRLKWQQRDLADAKATLSRQANVRFEEQRRQQRSNEEHKRANEELAKLQADAADAERARSRLQQQLRQLRWQFGDSETARLSAVVAAGTAKAETFSVLAELLGESDRAAEIYAEEADRAYVAGSSCERTYDVITN